jgi:hypothetical protein
MFRNYNILIDLDNNVNGDKQILFDSVLKGELFYIDSVMSVYNFGTLYSASNNTSKVTLYKKAFNFLNLVDKRTKYKYFLFLFAIQFI